ncbi:MAG TPA: oxygenase MpaB family protein [Allosphingosinicella sp.]|nr:oxygenase MpaB family protein [Allosphingosinicella sp.]
MFGSATGPAGAAALPGPLQRRLDATAAAFIRPAGAPEVDFSKPKGEPALVPFDSVSWRLFKSPIPLFIGGIAAVLLEFGEPRVRDGVWQHSDFRDNALQRLQRTGLAAMITVYGPHSLARTLIAGVVRRHGAVTGQTADGQTYDANDPELLTWVQATAGYGFTEAYHAFVHPLSRKERAALLVEGLPAAHLYGATTMPGTLAEYEALFETMRDRLEPSPIVGEFLAIMNRVPAFPLPLRPFQRLLVRAAVDILPDWARARLGLQRKRLRPWQRALVRFAARKADRVLIRSSPAVQACRRMGLPDDYLYR